MNNTFYPLLLLLLLPLVCGCGQKLPPGMPPLQPCQITITQDNKPLEGADIRLHPSGTGTQWSSSGTTDSTGVANLVTHGQYPGVPEGSYKITVQKIEVVSLATPAQLAALEKAKAENPKWYDPPQIKQEFWQLVDAQYTSDKTTTLEITVVKGDNDQTFDIGKAVRVKQNVTE